jgi:C_GCAxxG_C_C family probable redox protein
MHLPNDMICLPLEKKSVKMHFMEKTTGDAAVEHFTSGFNCAESVSLALREYFGISSDLIPAAATGMGGGIGRCGRACGAFTGAVIAMGLKLGRKSPEDDRNPLYAAVRELEKRFIEKFGDVDCAALIGFDIRTKEGFETARASGVLEIRCKEFVRFAADNASELSGA